MRASTWFALSLLASTACIGCASSSEGAAPEERVPAPTSAGGESATAAPAFPEDLLGEWAEYWALAGRAETQRYTFGADGRFSFRPSADGPAREGTYRVEGQTLVLQSEDDEPEHLALGQCPPNQEARQLDSGYRCMSIGDRAFWRTPAGR